MLCHSQSDKWTAADCKAFGGRGQILVSGVIGKVPVTGQKRWRRRERTRPPARSWKDRRTSQLRCSQTPSSAASSYNGRDEFVLNPTANPRSVRLLGVVKHLAVPNSLVRSEEHTSELQSLRHLVCRLLLEKKKKKKTKKTQNNNKK